MKVAFRANGYRDLEFVVIEAKDSDQDPRIVEIYYSSVIKPDTEYILPRVQLEISCRSLREPFTLRAFGSLVDEFYAGHDFTESLFDVPTVNAERTCLDPIPPKEVIAEWEADYAKMKEDMIYEEKKPSFEDLISNLEYIRSQLKAVTWSFELTYPSNKH